VLEVQKGWVREERHTIVYRLAVRLLRGETLHAIDRHRRVWRATATALYLLQPGAELALMVVESDAYDVAERFASALPSCDRV
jgi:hypothetical protein